jgi:hypothetical protein
MKKPAIDPRTPLKNSQDLFVESVVVEIFLFNELGPLIKKKISNSMGKCGIW